MQLPSAVMLLISWVRAASRQRSDSAGVLLSFASEVPCTASTVRAASIASILSDLPCIRRTCRVGRSTSLTAYPAAERSRASPAPYEFVPSTPTTAILPASRRVDINSRYPRRSAVKVAVSTTPPVAVRIARVCVSAWVSTPAIKSEGPKEDGVAKTRSSLRQLAIDSCREAHRCRQDADETSTMAVSPGHGTGHAPIRSCADEAQGYASGRRTDQFKDRLREGRQSN